jgi:integrase
MRMLAACRPCNTGLSDEWSRYRNARCARRSIRGWSFSHNASRVLGAADTVLGKIGALRPIDSIAIFRITALKAIVSEEAGVRNVILDDADRRTLGGAAYRDSKEFGLLIDILDETGARPSQVVRLTGEDVQTDFIHPRIPGRREARLMMPVSRKGSGIKQLATGRCR